MTTDKVLTPLAQLKEKALDLVMANAPDLDIVSSTKLTQAIADELLDAQKGAALRAIDRVEARLTDKGLA